MTAATITIWEKQLKKSLIHGEEVFGMLLQPILWVVLFGVGMRSLMGMGGSDMGDGYMTFVLPGIIALTAVSAAISGGSTWLNERLLGVVKEYLVAPIPRLSILMGHALYIVTQVAIQSLIILLVGLLMGARLHSNPLGWLAGFYFVTTYGLGFSGIALAVASKTESSGGYHVLIFLLQLPLLFWSNSLYPLDLLPGWMRIGALFNPTTYAVSGLRQVTMASVTMGSSEPLSLWLCVVVLLVFAVLGMGLALRAFKSAVS